MMNDSDGNPDPPDSSLPYAVVGIGASAGGLAALQSFISGIPPDSKAAFVILQHLSPNYDSMMVPLLQRRTQLEVRAAQDGMIPERGTVTILPPNYDLILDGGQFRLLGRDAGAPSALHVPIDQFFHSLADDQGENAVGIVLSGTGTDGSRGVVSIRKAGGLVMAQSPGSAEFDGMPLAAIATGMVHVEGTPAELAAAVLRRHEAWDLDVSANGSVFDELLSVVRTRTDLDLTLYREATLIRRLKRRMQVLGLKTPGQYLSYMREVSTEAETFKQDILIGVTSLFRDGATWDYLIKELLPRLLERSKGRTFRAWSAGCSTGEEAYSLCIAILEAARQERRSTDVRIFATDLNAAAIRRAGDGEFTFKGAAGVPEDLLERYFVRSGTGYRVARTVRERLTFATHNLLEDPPFTRLDLATCRNLMIYLRPHAQQRVLQRLHFGLAPEGHLVLGDSESVGREARFEPVDKRRRVFRAVGRPVASLRSAPQRRRVEPSRKGGGSSLQKAVVTKFAPPGVAITPDFDVVHVFGDVSRFIRLPEGQASTDLRRMLPPASAMMVSTAVARRSEQEDEVRLPSVVVSDGSQQDVRIDTFSRGRDEDPGFMIFFEESSRLADELTTLDLDDAVEQHINGLKAELETARAHLHVAVEDLERSNQELQATNEELVASNEELQSTNEELQSVNEELYTVNAELQQKIEELGQLSDDLDLLLRNLEIATLYVDRELVVQRFNPLATQLVPLMDSDIGRRMTDLAWRVDLSDVLELVEDALRSGEPSHRDLADAEGEMWRFMVRQHENPDHPATEGVLMTMVNVSSEHRTVAALTQSMVLQRAALRLGRIGLLVIDLNHRRVEASAPARELLGLSREEDLDFDRVADLMSPHDPADGPVMLDLPSGAIPVRVFARPTNTPGRLAIVLQRLSEAGGSTDEH